MEGLLKGMIEKEKNNEIIAAALKSASHQEIRKKLSELGLMEN